MLKLKIQFSPGIEPLDPTAAARVVKSLNEFLPDVPSGQVNVKVTDQAEVQTLNKKYSGLNEPTDVLSFDYRENQPVPTDEIGDVVVSAQHVASQAAKAKTDTATELGLLVLHGALHLIGYDHTSKIDQQTMNDLQREVMESAGLVYRDFAWK